MYALTVYCPSNGRCVISCNDDSACDSGTILAQPNTRSLSIECGDYTQSCSSLYVRCPDRYQSVDYNCILNVTTTSGSPISYVDLFSENNKVLIHCTYSSSPSKCYSSSSPPVLHCGTEWIESCDLNLVTNYNGWQCIDTGNVCNQYVTMTSSPWTHTPTVHPITLRPTSVGTAKITCNSDGSCRNQVHHCTEGLNCYIECKGANACDSATFYCTPGAFNCTVFCSGSTNLASSGGCRSMIINATGTNGGNLIVDGINKNEIMRYLTVYCPSNGKCIISCLDDYACTSGTILAQPNTRLLSITCGDFYGSCSSLYMRCPDRFQSVDYNCVLNASSISTNSGVISSIDLYSENNKVLIHCTYSSSPSKCYSSSSPPV
eukprot:180695_1